MEMLYGDGDADLGIGKKDRRENGTLVEGWECGNK